MLGDRRVIELGKDGNVMASGFRDIAGRVARDTLVSRQKLKHPEQSAEIEVKGML